jgi:phosphate:Na+ symporter
MPELSTIQLQKEVENFGKIVIKMDTFFHEMVNSTDVKRQRKLIKKLKQYEARTDSLELEITDYITQLMKEEMTVQTSILFRNLLTISNEMERIADLYCALAEVWHKKMEEKIYFLPEQRDEINKMSEKLNVAYQVMNENLGSSVYENVDKSLAGSAELEINNQRNKMRKDHLKRLGSPDYNLNSAMVYNNVFTTLENIGDHIMTITNAIVGDLYK